MENIEKIKHIIYNCKIDLLSISACNCFEIINRYASLTELVTSPDFSKNGLFAHYFGIPIYIYKDMDEGYFSISKSGSPKFSFSDDIYLLIKDINRKLGLKIYW